MQTTQVCALCNSNSEDAHHLLTDCTFTRQVIHHIWPWQNFEGSPGAGSTGTRDSDMVNNLRR
jgi:hypothetical protein